MVDSSHHRAGVLSLFGTHGSFLIELQPNPMEGFTCHNVKNGIACSGCLDLPI
jgi:hypothetical protein